MKIIHESVNECGCIRIHSLTPVLPPRLRVFVRDIPLFHSSAAFSLRDFTLDSAKLCG
jgi:hypothetical protein